MERTLRERLADVPGEGTVEWIGLRPAHRADVLVVPSALAIEGCGLEGDRASLAGRVNGKRQVTLVQAEHLDVLARLLRRPRIDPELLRRNLVVSRINLVALKTLVFAVGDDVVLEGTGPCEPCSRMDEALGNGGFASMRGHGGITTRVLEGGVVRLGDRVRVVPRPR